MVEPKSATGRRNIVLGEATVVKLRAHRKLQLEQRVFYGNRWEDFGLVFTNTFGRPQDASQIRRDFQAILREAGLPLIRFHDLRHTAASLMLRSGIHPKVVQERLGHASISITLDRYSHLVPSLQREAAEMIDSLIS